MLANTPPMLEAHYGVPMTGAVLNALNTRLDAAAMAFMLDHGDGQGVDHRPRILRRRSSETLKLAKVKPIVIDYDDPRISADSASASARSTMRLSSPAAIRNSSGRCRPTNGTRSRSITPRHHRQSQGRRLPPSRRRADGLWQCRRRRYRPRHPVYLWTLPMFHCNGWCFPWTLSVRRRHPCVPALGARQGDVRRDRRAQASPICAARPS